MSVLLVPVLMAVAGAPATSEAAPGDALVTVRCRGTRHDTRATGFLIAPGVVATALHAVTGSEPNDVPRSIRVTFANGTTRAIASVLAFDPARDVALLRVRGTTARPIPLGEDPERGDRVRVLTRSSRRPRAPLYARVLAVEDDDSGRCRVDRPLTRRSGSPVLDASGRVVGLVSTTYGFVHVRAIHDLLAWPNPVRPYEAHRALMETPWGLLGAAAHARSRGRTADAIRYLREAAALEPPLAEVYATLGRLLAARRHAVAAAVEYRVALFLDPGDTASRRALATLEARLRGEADPSRGPELPPGFPSRNRLWRAPRIAVVQAPVERRTYALTWAGLLALPGYLVSRWRNRRWRALAEAADDTGDDVPPLPGPPPDGAGGPQLRRVSCIRRRVPMAGCCGATPIRHRLALR